MTSDKVLKSGKNRKNNPKKNSAVGALLREGHMHVHKRLQTAFGATWDGLHGGWGARRTRSAVQ